MPSSTAGAFPDAASRNGAQEKEKSVRAEVWSSNNICTVCALFPVAALPGWRGSVPGERHKSCGVICLVNAVLLQDTAAVSSWLGSFRQW